MGPLKREKDNFVEYFFKVFFYSNDVKFQANAKHGFCHVGHSSA